MFLKRMEQIMSVIEQDGFAKVSQLSELCNVTEKTIRNDLNELARMNLVNRVHGGAVVFNNENEVFPLQRRKKKYADEKKTIASAALDLISDGDILFIDAGSTTLELARLINKQVVIMTNDPFIASELAYRDNISLYATGGYLQRYYGSYSFIGSDTLAAISRHHTQKCIIGCSALNIENGLMVFSTEEAAVKRAIIAASQQTIVLADHSKFQKIAFTSFASLEEIDYCITDQAIEAEYKKIFEKSGVQLIVAE